ncbi:hypothetical protein DCO58_02695 [Helicobacter saguini]|uniref:Uncharacterized protein n=1 Tax=Helicobacter saguini TaxID=1548018 RepID=A0A4U8T3Y1_9HELI|nr:hypothetical protein [Helicobacter saguini]MWV62714.1 hypothetical protein [Helicobacter saguini]MWV66615.1 hypothetical protein [Helicobacter saguini]TLD94124.1 hypothetical protein LS64_007405 [Helicobacter saguini]
MVKLAWVFFIFSGSAFAYLDPGTGSLLLSSFIALIASVIFFLKGSFYRILDLFKNANTTNTTGGGGNITLITKMRI